MTGRILNPAKEKWLKENRGASAEEILEDGELIDCILNTIHPGQTIEVYRFQNYIWAVIIDSNRVVTAWPSRKLNRKYRK